MSVVIKPDDLGKTETWHRMRPAKPSTPPGLNRRDRRAYLSKLRKLTRRMPATEWADAATEALFQLGVDR